MQPAVSLTSSDVAHWQYHNSGNLTTRNKEISDGGMAHNVHVSIADSCR